MNDFDYAPFDSTSMPGLSPLKGGNPVQQLPTLPAAHALLALAGLDTLAPAAAAGNGAAPAPAPGTAPSAGKDVRLVIAAFTIPWPELYDQWNKAFGPVQPGGQPRLSPAQFELVAITAYRSEKIGDKWVDDPNPVQIINGSDLPPYPQAGNKPAEVAYLQAISKSPKSIPTPDIPTVIAGASWKDPIQYLPGATPPQPVNPPGGGDQGTSFSPGSGSPRFVNAANQLNDKVDVQYGPPSGFRGGGPPAGWRPPVAPVAPPTDQTPPDQPAPPPAVPPEDGTVTPVTVLANPNAAAANVPQDTPPQLNLVAYAARRCPISHLYRIYDRGGRKNLSLSHRLQEPQPAVQQGQQSRGQGACRVAGAVRSDFAPERVVAGDQRAETDIFLLRAAERPDRRQRQPRVTASRSPGSFSPGRTGAEWQKGFACTASQRSAIRSAARSGRSITTPATRTLTRPCGVTRHSSRSWIGMATWTCATRPRMRGARIIRRSRSG